MCAKPAFLLAISLDSAPGAVYPLFHKRTRSGTLQFAVMPTRRVPDSPRHPVGSVSQTVRAIQNIESQSDPGVGSQTESKILTVEHTGAVTAICPQKECAS